MQDGYLESMLFFCQQLSTKKFNVAKGVSISYLMHEANIKQEAYEYNSWSFWWLQGAMWQDQLLGRYRFPEVISGSAANPVLVQSVLAWVFRWGRIFQIQKRMTWVIVIGQQGINDVNTVSSQGLITKYINK